MAENNVNINKEIGMIIKLLRTRRELSQEKLGELACLNKNTIGLIERGMFSPSIDTLYSISKALGVELKDLVDIKKFDL